MDIKKHNRQAWNKMAIEGSEWSRPADHELIEYAREGNVALYLTPSRPCPQDWLPDFTAKDLLALGAGGGLQGPILAAAGALVTVFDTSLKQLAIDLEVCEREKLAVETFVGDMSDLSVFPEASFDIIVNPVSNLYVPDVGIVWKEVFRVLKNGGILMAGFMNPAFYIFDRNKMDQEGILEVKNHLPYSDENNLTNGEREILEREVWPYEFGHTLEQQIGGQMQAGFTLTGFYEDRDPRSALFDTMPIYIATKSEKIHKGGGG
jgi:SAM-dependent methyltransferase